MTLRAVLFDVDFTLAKPGPDLGPEGYQLLGRRFGLELDPSRYAEARAAAVETLERHPELDHDEEVWVALHRSASSRAWAAARTARTSAPSR